MKYNLIKSCDQGILRFYMQKCKQNENIPFHKICTFGIVFEKLVKQEISIKTIDIKFFKLKLSLVEKIPPVVIHPINGIVETLYR